MSLQIKFAHNFVKINDQKKATLLAVNDIPVKMLHHDFIEQDTIYHCDEGFDNYPMPKGNVSVLVLTFLGDKLIPFSTFRSWGTAKKLKFMSQIGQTFEIVIEENVGSKKEPENPQQALPIEV